MTFEQIMITYYASYFNQGLFRLRGTDEGIEIFDWNVPDVPQPTYDEVMALDTPELEHQYAANQFFQQFSPFMQQFIDYVAIARGYGSSLYCLSYLNSSIPQWVNDAQAFNAWRDSAWVYIGQQQVLILNGTRPIPTNLSDLTNELPAIVWPS